MEDRISKSRIWLKSSDRRFAVIKEFGRSDILSPTDIAKSTGRTVQNVGLAISELVGKGMIRPLEDDRKTWKKFEMTEYGKLVRQSLYHDVGSTLLNRFVNEISMRYVRDAHRLIVRNPITVTKEMTLIQTIERILSDYRTRTAYVIDKKRRLIGSIGLIQIFKALDARIFEGGTIVPSQKKDGCNELRIESFMVRPIATTEDELLAVAMKKMIKNRLTDLPVVDDSNELVGELNGLEIILLGNQLLRR